MAGNTFGKIYKISSFGESHGEAVGGIIDGYPANQKINIDAIKLDLERRSTNSGIYSSSRNEKDNLEIISGFFEGKSLGTPIGFIIRNTDTKSSDYEHLKNIYRPSHADYSWEAKYGHRDYRGGGRSSARETISRVVAGSLAKQYLRKHGIEIQAWVKQIYNIQTIPDDSATFDKIENSSLRCPDPNAELQMLDAIKEAAAKGDTLGGVIRCRIVGVKAGIGEPVFDKLNSVLAKAMLSINAAKGFEYGSGFEATNMKGSEHNDEFFQNSNRIATKTNNSGGIQGGISNGENILFNVAFKPVASIKIPQKSINNKGKSIELSIKGRHDVCVVPRAVPIVEAMAAMVIMDYLLMQKINQV